MHLLILTIVLRPYVFVFLGCYLAIAIINFGLRTTLLFTLLTYTVAWACEWNSVHNGFPFGLYHYVPTTLGREIWVFGVPFMDSISFTFLSFTSYTVALLLCSPIYRRGRDLRVLDTWKLRASPRVSLLAALLMVMVDMVADPLSVLGDRWFLGRIFWYDPPGPHFGVPISNYLGWYLVGAITVAIFQSLDRLLNRGSGKPAGMVPAMPSRVLMGPALYLGIVCFVVTMLFRVGAAEIGWAGVFIFLPLVALGLNIVTRRDCQGDSAAVEKHLADFPYERNLPVWSPPALETIPRRRGVA